MKLINTHVNITKLKKKLPQTKIASFFFYFKGKKQIHCIHREIIIDQRNFY